MTNKPNNWEEEFDKEFADRQVIGDRTFKDYHEYLYPDIKLFFHQTLQSEKEETYKQGYISALNQIEKDIDLLGINGDVWEDDYKQELIKQLN